MGNTGRQHHPPVLEFWEGAVALKEKVKNISLKKLSITKI